MKKKSTKRVRPVAQRFPKQTYHEPQRVTKTPQQARIAGAIAFGVLATWGILMIVILNRGTL